MTASIQDLFDIHCLPALEKQHRLDTLLDGQHWQLDFDAGTIIFNNQYAFPVQLIGLEDESNQTWLWGWANHDVGISEHLLREVNSLWEYGERYDIDLISDPHFPMDEFDGRYLSLIASGVSRASCYYRCAYKDSVAYLLLSAKIIDKQPGWMPEEFVESFTQLIDSYPFNHKTAFLSFCTWRGWVLSGEGSTFRIDSPAGKAINIEFDRASRLTHVDIV